LAAGLPSSSFDVVHDRTLLVNIPDPAAVVAEMTRLARPGGWVAGMEPDLPGLLCHPPLPAWDRPAEISVAAFQADGADPCTGRRVPGLFRQAGLTDVGAEVRAELYPAGHSRRIIRLDLVRNMRVKIVSQAIAGERGAGRTGPRYPGSSRRPGRAGDPDPYFMVWGRKKATSTS